MEKRQIKILAITFAATLIGVLGIVFLVRLVVWPGIQNLMTTQQNPRGNLVRFHDHWNLDPNIPNLVWGGTRITSGMPPLVQERGGDYFSYIPVTFLREHIDPFWFWDEGAQVLFASTRYEILEFTPEERTFYINDTPHQLNAVIRRIGNEFFIPQDLIKSLYPLTISFHPEYNMVVMDIATESRTRATVVGNRIPVHYLPNSRAPITIELSQGDTVLFFGDEVDGFQRVRTETAGLLGHIEVANLQDITVIEPPQLTNNWLLGRVIDNTTHVPLTWREPINMVWEAIYVQAANANLMQTPFHPSVNVVSPQWFRISPDGSELESIASRAYVDWAHQQGVSVWPMVFDVTEDGRVGLFLQNRETRQNAIEQLLYFIETFNLDGLNIDFEHLVFADGLYKIQFLRELSVAIRQQINREIILSAAVKVPLSTTMFYRRDLIGLTLDFVMVMTYDEHWATSPTIGPVASLGFVEWGVANMLREVPRDRLVMGLPFYNRIWREDILSDVRPRALHLGMDATRDLFEEHNVEWVWDSAIGSYFGEVVILNEGVTIIHRVWLEDERSIAEKMRIFYENNLAGVASWRRGFENPATWEVIARYVN